MEQQNLQYCHSVAIVAYIHKLLALQSYICKEPKDTEEELMDLPGRNVGMAFCFDDIILDHEGSQRRARPLNERVDPGRAPDEKQKGFFFLFSTQIIQLTLSNKSHT